MEGRGGVRFPTSLFYNLTIGHSVSIRSTAWGLHEVCLETEIRTPCLGLAVSKLNKGCDFSPPTSAEKKPDDGGR